MDYTNISITSQGEFSIVTFQATDMTGRLELHETEKELIDFVRRVRPKRLIINFSLISLASSQVINLLIKARDNVLFAGGQMRLCSVPPQIREMFQITKLDGTLFKIDDTLPEAKAAFDAPAE